MTRCLIKYISPLLISGLILPFYYSAPFKTECFKLLPHFTWLATGTAPYDKQPQTDSDSFMKNIAGDLFPVLKNLQIKSTVFSRKY